MWRTDWQTNPFRKCSSHKKSLSGILQYDVNAMQWQFESMGASIVHTHSAYTFTMISFVSSVKYSKLSTLSQVSRKLRYLLLFALDWTHSVLFYISPTTSRSNNSPVTSHATNIVREDIHKTHITLPSTAYFSCFVLCNWRNLRNRRKLGEW